jgi:hypothetical protein
MYGSFGVLITFAIVLFSAVLYLRIERPFLLSQIATRHWRPAAHPADPEIAA